MKKSELKALIKEYIKDYIKESDGFFDDTKKSQWGTSNEILSDVLRTLERNVEWPLTEIMDGKEVNKLLAPLRNAINAKISDIER